MNQFSSTNSLSTLLYPHEDSKSPSDDHVYSREFQAMLDGLDDEDGTYMEGTGLNEDKRKRLSNNQVKALEKIFKVDNKLDPVRKATLAQELGLQPRQIAIWFQNRRARWKTKQLERDYSHLKANYETLKQNYEKLEQNKDNLISELRGLKVKLEDKNTERNQSILQCNGLSGVPELSNNFGNSVETKGLSDSDSNRMLNEDTSQNFQMLIDTPALSTPRLDISSFSSSSQLNNYEEFWDSRGVSRNAYQQPWLKMEEGCAFGSSEESCNIFSVDQAPSLRW